MGRAGSSPLRVRKKPRPQAGAFCWALSIREPPSFAFGAEGDEEDEHVRGGDLTIPVEVRHAVREASKSPSRSKASETVMRPSLSGRGAIVDGVATAIVSVAQAGDGPRGVELGA